VGAVTLGWTFAANGDFWGSTGNGSTWRWTNALIKFGQVGALCELLHTSVLRVRENIPASDDYLY
jgi:hypothetical protein